MFYNRNEKRKYVHNLFDSIAKDYDRINQVITFGMNAVIKDSSIKKVLIKPNSKILDVCTGTGDIAIRLAKKHADSEITAIDFSENMLNIAKNRAKNIPNIKFINGDAMNLPFEDSYFDAVFISYGLRNLESTEHGLKEMIRVTKDNGYISNLDLGKPNPLFNIILRPYFFHIVPLMGKILHGDSNPYKYLPESGDEFISQQEIVDLLKQFGCENIRNYNYVFGAIAQQTAKVRK